MSLSIRTDPASGAALHIVGEELILEALWVDKRGRQLGIEETEQHACTIFRANGETIASVNGAIVGGMIDPRIRFAFPLAIGAQLVGAGALYYSLARLIASTATPPGLPSTSTYFTASLPVRALAGTVVPPAGAPPAVGAPATQIAFTPTGVQISPRGASGPSASQQLAATRDPATGLPYIADPSVATMFAKFAEPATVAKAASEAERLATAQVRVDTEATRAATEIARANAEGVVDGAAALLAARDDAQFAKQAAEAAAASIPDAFEVSQSDVYDGTLESADGGVYVGHRFTDDRTFIHRPVAELAQFARQLFGGALIDGGIEIDVVESSNWRVKLEYQDGGVPAGIGIDGAPFSIASPGAIGGGGGSPLVAQSWIADFAYCDAWLMICQSQGAGRKAEKPDTLMAAMSQPVATGNWLMFGRQGPRTQGEGTESLRNVLAPATRFVELTDLKEADTGQDAATTAWGFAKLLVDAGQTTGGANIAGNVGIGGSTAAELGGANGSRVPDNRRRFLDFAARHAREKGAFRRRAIANYWQQSASRTLSRPGMTAEIAAILDGFAAEARSCGWLETMNLLGTVAAAYQGNTKSSAAALAALDLALARTDTVHWGADYIAEPAVGALAVAIGDDTLHLSGLGQLRIAFLMGRAWRHWLETGVRVFGLYVAPGTATLSNNGTRVTLPFVRPAGLAGTMRHEGSHVLDPAASGGAQADPKRPFGLAVGATGGDGSMLHPSVTPVPGSFAWTGDTLGFDLSGDIRAGGGTCWINHANWFDDPVLQSGPDRGARSTVWLDTGEIKTVAGIDIPINPVAVPQRIVLV